MPLLEDLNVMCGRIRMIRNNYKIVISEFHFIESKKADNMSKPIANSTSYSSESQIIDPFHSDEVYPDPFVA